MSTHSNSGPDILREEDALELDNEEVNQLLKVTSNGLESLARDGVVFPGAHAGGKALAEHKLTNDLSSSGGAEDGERGLEDIALDRDVAGEENAGDNGGEGDGSRARVLPAEERVEQGVVVGQVLAGGSLPVGRLASSGQVGELVLGDISLSAGLVGDRAVGKVLHSLGVLDGIHGVLSGYFAG